MSRRLGALVDSASWRVLITVRLCLEIAWVVYPRGGAEFFLVGGGGQLTGTIVSIGAEGARKKIL